MRKYLLTAVAAGAVIAATGSYADEAAAQKWIDEGAAVGTAANWADQLMAYLDAGADEILLHGSAPKDMGALTTELKRALAARGDK